MMMRSPDALQRIRCIGDLRLDNAKRLGLAQRDLVENFQAAQLRESSVGENGVEFGSSHPADGFGSGAGELGGPGAVGS
jgi:hypothetical protein